MLSTNASHESSISFQELLQRITQDLEQIQNQISLLAKRHEWDLRILATTSPIVSAPRSGSSWNQSALDDLEHDLTEPNASEQQRPCFIRARVLPDDPGEPSCVIVQNDSALVHSSSDIQMSNSDGASETPKSPQYSENPEYHTEGEAFRPGSAENSLELSTYLTDGEVFRPGMESIKNSREIKTDNSQESNQKIIRPSGRRSTRTLRTLAKWPIWSQCEHFEEADALDSEVFRNTASMASVTLSRKLSQDTDTFKAGDEIAGRGFLQSLVLRPTSACRVVWDMGSVIVLGYDVVMLPLQPFGLEKTTAISILEILTTVFWSLDIFFSFTTGFHSMGFVEMRLNKIARRYMRSWFPLDVSILSIDWFQFFAAEDGVVVDFLGFGRATKALRILRVLRIFRLLRIMKVISRISELTPYSLSETASTSLGIIKLVVMICLANHFLACGWYAVGTLETEESTWVQKLEATDSVNASFAWLYTSSLHWSITQFTPASMEIVPVNVLERLYAVCVIIFALVAFSSFVSSITSAMAHLRRINSEQDLQNDMIRQYLTENKVSLELGNRIQKFLQEQRQTERERKRVHEADIPSLMTLPEFLRVHLRSQVFLPFLSTHPLFQKIHKIDKEGILTICRSAMTERSLLSSFELFTKGGSPTGMSFVVSGELAYYHGYETEFSRVSVDHSICEMALWVQWEHSGRLVATVNSEFVELNRAQFHDTVMKLSSFILLRTYAERYTQRINEVILAEQTQALSDIWDGSDMIQALVSQAADDVINELEEFDDGTRHTLLENLEAVNRSMFATARSGSMSSRRNSFNKGTSSWMPVLKKLGSKYL